jgi:hypothetical protein
MLGDDSTKKLRYAVINLGEVPELYAPIHLLGRKFTRHP